MALTTPRTAVPYALHCAKKYHGDPLHSTTESLALVLPRNNNCGSTDLDRQHLLGHATSTVWYWSRLNVNVSSLEHDCDPLDSVSAVSLDLQLTVTCVPDVVAMIAMTYGPTVSNSGMTRNMAATAMYSVPN